MPSVKRQVCFRGCRCAGPAEGTERIPPTAHGQGAARVGDAARRHGGEQVRVGVVESLAVFGERVLERGAEGLVWRRQGGVHLAQDLA